MNLQLPCAYEEIRAQGQLLDSIGKICPNVTSVDDVIVNESRTSLVTFDTCICWQAGALDREAAALKSPWQATTSLVRVESRQHCTTNLVALETVFRLLDEEFPQLKVRTVVVMQRRPDVRRQACGNCRGRSSSQDRAPICVLLKHTLVGPVEIGQFKNRRLSVRSPSRAMPLIVTNRSRDRLVEVQYGPRLFCQSDYRS